MSREVSSQKVEFFHEELNDRQFKLMNIEKNFAKDGHPIPHKTLHTSIKDQGISTRP